METKETHKCHLSEPTLVLNSAWQPITIASVRRAICKVTLGLASFLDHETYCLHDFPSWMTLEPHGDDYINMARHPLARVLATEAVTDKEVSPR